MFEPGSRIALYPWLLPLVLIACAEEADLTFVELADLDLVAYFIVVAGPNDPEAHGPFGPEVADRAPRITVDEEEQRVFVLGLTDAILRSASPRYDPSKIAQLRARPGSPTPSCPTGVRTPASDHVRLGWPAQSPTFELDRETQELNDIAFGDTAFADELLLEIPIDPDSCGEPSPSDAPAFGARLELIPQGTVFDGESYDADGTTEIRDVLRIDRERVVVAFGANVMLLERGAELIDDPAHRVRLEPSVGYDGVFSASLSALPRPDGSTSLWVGGGNVVAGILRPKVWELRLTSGGLTFVASATAPASVVKDLLIVPKTERLVVLLEDLSVITSSAAGATFVRHTLPPPMFESPPQHLAALPFDDTPLAVVGKNGLLILGDQSASSWRSIGGKGADVGLIFRAIGGFVGPDGLEIWVGGSAGVVRRVRPPLDPEAITLQVPGSYAPCSNSRDDGCGFPKQPLAFRKFVAWGGSGGSDRVFAFGESCHGGLIFRTSDVCATALTIGGQAIRSATTFSAGHLFEDYLTIGGPEGAVAEVELP